MENWKASNIENAKYIGEIEIENGEIFRLLETKKKIVFGGHCNAGFLESGFIKKDKSESLDETFRGLVEDLETYYRDGAKYTNRIVCNERM